MIMIEKIMLNKIGQFWVKFNEIDLFKFDSFIYKFVLMVIVGVSITSLIPPMQSPDEISHIRRAYFISAGSPFLVKDEIGVGGLIDKNFLAYTQIYEVIPL